MHRINLFFAVFTLHIYGTLLLDNVVLPSIIWDPTRPIFACDDPTIHVKLADRVNFICPHNELTSYMADQKESGKMFYENLYFLGTDKEAFETCNATNGKLLLRCSQRDSFESVFNIVFRPYKTKPGAIVFSEGKNHYFISTAYRTKENLDNKINGSCNTVEKDGYYKLRLKIYVCTAKEIEDGMCNVCKSEGCYYKDCATSCTPWKDDTMKSVNSNCSMLQKRECTNRLLVSSRYEYQEVPWKCNPKVSLSVASVHKEKERGGADQNMYKYLAACLSIVFLILGIFVGAFFYRRYHAKSCAKQIFIQQQPPKSIFHGMHLNGQANIAYRHCFYDNYECRPSTKEMPMSVKPSP